MSGKRLINIAHRGASSYAPENTLSSFDLALDMGIKDIELDVHFTKDHSIVVIHDDTVDRTTNGVGYVSNMTLFQIQKLDAGSWFGGDFSDQGISTLAEIFDRYLGKLNFHIEIKARGAADLASRTCDMVRDYKAENNVVITSFWKQWVEESTLYAPEIKTGWLVPMGPGSMWEDRFIDEAVEAGFDQLCPRAELITPTLVDKIHNRGLKVRCHGVFDENLMKIAVNCGVDGMTINFPDKLQNYLSENDYLID
ncbi:MAG: hypothetical protein EGP08_04270 [SAR202 cluster bacterium]|mgnify:FL=1|nr:MAG: hypothetical protein EGP08_04270 [SAR202 cluster bacterium]MCH2319204.1 hypothetical protein [SAR202 cluster bacterium]MQF68085.1 hypothetical protein [SAR202 cluster bacterium AD-802-K11_MRT_200m]